LDDKKNDKKNTTNERRILKIKKIKAKNYRFSKFNNLNLTSRFVSYDSSYGSSLHFNKLLYKGARSVLIKKDISSIEPIIYLYSYIANYTVFKKLFFYETIGVGLDIKSFYKYNTPKIRRNQYPLCFLNGSSSGNNYNKVTHYSLNKTYSSIKHSVLNSYSRKIINTSENVNYNRLKEYGLSPISRSRIYSDIPSKYGFSNPFFTANFSDISVNNYDEKNLFSSLSTIDQSSLDIISGKVYKNWSKYSIKKPFNYKLVGCISRSSIGSVKKYIKNINNLY
jgi:hypothetical protein